MQTVTLKNLPRHAMLTLETGVSVEVVHLGKGRYTTAWRCVSDPGKVFLQVSDKDRSKEMLSKLEGPHIPKMWYMGTFGEDQTLYQTKFYEPLTAAVKPAWRLFKTLEKYREQAWENQRPKSYDTRERVNVQAVNEDFASLIEEDEELPQSIREDVRALVNWACSYGDYLVEIAKRNLAVDGETLILLDPVFDYAELERANREARKRAERRRYSFA